jgi:hypothetical protein
VSRLRFLRLARLLFVQEQSLEVRTVFNRSYPVEVHLRYKGDVTFFQLLENTARFGTLLLLLWGI